MPTPAPTADPYLTPTSPKIPTSTSATSSVNNVWSSEAVNKAGASLIYHTWTEHMPWSVGVHMGETLHGTVRKWKERLLFVH